MLIRATTVVVSVVLMFGCGPGKPRQQVQRTDLDESVVSAAQRDQWASNLRRDHHPCDSITRVWTFRTTPTGTSYMVSCSGLETYIYAEFANGNHFSRPASLMEK